MHVVRSRGDEVDLTAVGTHQRCEDVATYFEDALTEVASGHLERDDIMDSMSICVRSQRIMAVG